MSRYLPIVYVRGYAGTQGDVESAVDLPYYGFNLGSTKVRTGSEGSPEFFIFESPLIRLMKDHGYTDYFARINVDNQVELLKGVAFGKKPAQSLWIYRYYDVTSRSVGDGARDDIEKLADGLGRLIDHVLAETGAARVHLVAHSMGGLVCRSLLQRAWKDKAHKKVDRLFTYATPHGGIHFRRGLGFLTTVRDLFGFNDSDTFGPRRMRQFLGFPTNWDEGRLNELSGSFPIENTFSLVGTNHTDYDLSRRLTVGPGSDGLVQIDHAYIKRSARAFVYRAHSGPLGIVNSEEGYQNLQRFLFGETSVQIKLSHIRLDERFRDDKALQSIMIETQVIIRGLEVIMTDQREEHGSALAVTRGDLENGEETLFRTFMIKSGRPDNRHQYSFFQVRVRLLPHYVRDRQVARSRHFVGEALFEGTLTAGVRDVDDKPGRVLRAGWVMLEDDLPAAGTRHDDPLDIRFPLEGRNIVSGDLVLCVRDQ